MIRTVALAAIMAAPVAAETLPDRHVWPGTDLTAGKPAYVQIHEPHHPNAVASVTFQNETLHHMDQRMTLEWGGIRVDVLLDWQADGSHSERVTVTPPDGYIAIPESLTVGEGLAETLHIFKWQGM